MSESSSHGFRRDLFEIENARNLTRQELVDTFVPTRAFWRLLSAKHHVVLGSRGSGKTALAKMLSHDHLSQLQDPRARRAIKAQSFIGVYVPTRLEWVGGLRNKPWQDDDEKERFFQWRLNVATCQAVLATFKSCLDVYIKDRAQRARTEATLCAGVGQAWADQRLGCERIVELQRYLEDMEHAKQQQLARQRALGSRHVEDSVGVPFDADLFSPLRRAIALATRVLGFSTDTAWLLALDEAEFLELFHHRILNSHLRAYPGQLFFKITTMPYAHYTLATNTGVGLDVGHDFEYVYIDQDPILWTTKSGGEGRSFAERLFQKRARISGPKYRGLSLNALLGESELLDAQRADWGATSGPMELLRRYGSNETVARAEALAGSPRQFRDQIARKMHGALLLRDAVMRLRGRGELSVYAGEAMAVRCADANPRRLIRLFNSFLLQVKWPTSGRGSRTAKVEQISPIEQTRVLVAFSTSTLMRVKSEPECGQDLFDLIVRVGRFMQWTLHEGALTTDQLSSVIVDQASGREVWVLIQKAVGLGLLYPNISAKSPDQMPDGEGVFHLAYVLAPYFRILPRRGKARRLAGITSRETRAMDRNQLGLSFANDE